jgi:hypothetical protein
VAAVDMAAVVAHAAVVDSPAAVPEAAQLAGVVFVVAQSAVFAAVQ